MQCGHCQFLQYSIQRRIPRRRAGIRSRGNSVATMLPCLWRDKRQERVELEDCYNRMDDCWLFFKLDNSVRQGPTLVALPNPGQTLCTQHHERFSFNPKPGKRQTLHPFVLDGRLATAVTADLLLDAWHDSNFFHPGGEILEAFLKRKIIRQLRASSIIPLSRFIFYVLSVVIPLIYNHNSSAVLPYIPPV